MLEQRYRGAAHLDARKNITPEQRRSDEAKAVTDQRIKELLDDPPRPHSGVMYWMTMETLAKQANWPRAPPRKGEREDQRMANKVPWGSVYAWSDLAAFVHKHNRGVETARARAANWLNRGGSSRAR